MRLKIIRTSITATDGFILKELEEGAVFDVRESVAVRLLRNGRAILLGNLHDTDPVPDAPYRA